MAVPKMKVCIDFSAVLELNEDELRAFDALVGYGDDAFLEAFKKHLGITYIRDHEKGLRSAFKAIRDQVLPALYEIDQMRKAITLSIVNKRA